MRLFQRRRVAGQPRRRSFQLVTEFGDNRKVKRFILQHGNKLREVHVPPDSRTPIGNLGYGLG